MFGLLYYSQLVIINPQNGFLRSRYETERYINFMAAYQATVQILSAFWERDDENPSVKQQHGAFIWNEEMSGWGFRGRSNPFPRYSFWDPDTYSNSLWSGYREGFYQMCSTINKHNNKPAPVRFFATKATLGNSCWGHPKALTVNYLCVKGSNNKQYKTATAKENEEIVLSCQE